MEPIENENKKPVSLRMPPDQYNALKREAVRLGMTLNGYILTAIYEKMQKDRS